MTRQELELVWAKATAGRIRDAQRAERDKALAWISETLRRLETPPEEDGDVAPKKS